MEIDQREFAYAFQRFLEEMTRSAEGSGDQLTPLGRVVSDHLGVEINAVDPVMETFPQHQAVDVDGAARQLLQDTQGQLVGVSGRHREHVDSFLELLVHAHASFQPGPVSYARVAIGPQSDRRVVSFGISLLVLDGVPLAAMHRGANPQVGRPRYTLEVLGADQAVADTYLARMRELMSSGSVLRGQVVSFSRDEFDYHDPSGTIRFLERPRVPADQVILPDGVLERVTRHVVGIGHNRAALLAAGQHLKRGVLLYGPPGTGKTHLVRHLLGEAADATVVLLSGKTLGLLNDATKLGRANQPAIIVLEDCDLVAEERGGDTNAALFETLEALDGLDGDADITFILTTNRPDLLERALVERPGRVDLAVEIAKPDASARRQLIELYAGRLPFSGEAFDQVAERTEGATASFAKELIRRAVLTATQQGRNAADRDLLTALDEMMSEAEGFTRTLLGGGDFSPEESDDLEDFQLT